MPVKAEYATDEELNKAISDYRWDCFIFEKLFEDCSIEINLRERLEEVMFLLKVKIHALENIRKERDTASIIKKLEHYESFLLEITIP